jgi:DNA-binding response OmpR family regulator
VTLDVLYLDDEPDLCMIFSDEFTSDEIQIRTFTDPEMAITDAKRIPPQIIFLDYRLPATTGDQVAQAMPPGIPIYLVTGDITVKTSFSFEAVFDKPFNADEIRRVLNSWLKRRTSA